MINFSSYNTYTHPYPTTTNLAFKHLIHPAIPTLTSMPCHDHPNTLPLTHTLPILPSHPYPALHTLSGLIIPCHALRLVQYLSRLAWHNLESRKNLRDTVARLKIIESSFSTFRKCKYSVRLQVIMFFFFPSIN